MSDQLDPNAIAAKFIQQNIEGLLEIAENVLKGGTDKVRLHLDRTYKQYLSIVLEKYSKAKSFLLRGEPVPLYQFYIPLNLRFRSTLLSSPTLSDLQKISNFIIIAGSAGCGKSMMMRHLLLNSIVAKNKVPVFLELRQFNFTDTDLLGLIKQVLSLNKFNLDKNYVEKALAIGHFVFLLDGYDEVVNAKRSQVAINIHNFTKQYGNNTIILSSRPDRDLDGWQEFSLLQIQPLNLEQAYKLIEKVTYDEDLKKKFLDDLRKDLFKKHESFLSNPLLLSIMLLTYGQSANIPNKLNVFYNQAYEALFERHDALKCGYKRNRLTTLDIQDFARIFAAFCLQAYDKRQFEFDRMQALNYIEKSQHITGIKCGKDDYLKDLIQAVCLLVEEGLNIIYSHRSFQEYFTAKYIADARPDIQKKLIKKYSILSRNDNVFNLLYEIRPDVIEQQYLIPGIDLIFKTIGVKNTINKTHVMKYLEKAFSGISRHGDTFAFSGNDQSHLFVDLAFFALNHCGQYVDWSGFHTDKKHDNTAVLKRFGHENGKKTIDRIIFDKYDRKKELLNDVLSSGAFLNVDMLVALKKIRKVLKQKAILEEENLEEILSTKSD